MNVNVNSYMETIRNNLVCCTGTTALALSTSSSLTRQAILVVVISRGNVDFSRVFRCPLMGYYADGYCKETSIDGFPFFEDLRNRQTSTHSKFAFTVGYEKEASCKYGD